MFICLSGWAVEFAHMPLAVWLGANDLMLACMRAYGRRRGLSAQEKAQWRAAQADLTTRRKGQ